MDFLNTYFLRPLGFGWATPEENIQQETHNKRKRSEILTSESENTEQNQKTQNKRLKLNDTHFPGLRCKTSSWQNNCGLNCVTHFLFSKLENNQLQSLFLDNPNYQALLASFQEYYELPILPTWNDIRDLLAALEAPHDREAIFAPVLRKHLGKLMITQAQTFWDIEGAPSFSEYLSTGEINDIATPIFLANNEFFTELKKQYDSAFCTIKTDPITDGEVETALSQLNENKKALTEENLSSQIYFNRQNKVEEFYREIAKSYWIEGEGYKNYIGYITDVHHAQMISVDQLQLLCENLDIKAEVYTQYGTQNIPDGNFTWSLKVYNTGVHWEYEEPAANIEKKDLHNTYYPTEFYGHEPVFGIFKTYAHPEDDQVKKIKDIKNYVVNEILQIEPSLPTVIFNSRENINNQQNKITSEKQKNTAQNKYC